MTKHYAEPASKQNIESNKTVHLACQLVRLHSETQIAVHAWFDFWSHIATNWNMSNSVKHIEFSCSWPASTPRTVRDLWGSSSRSCLSETLMSTTFQDKHGIGQDRFVFLLFCFSTNCQIKNDRNSLKFGADQDFWIWRNSTNRGVNQSNQSEPTSVSLSKPSAALLKPKAMPEATCGQSGQSGQSLGSRLSWLKRGCESLWVTAFWWSLGGDVVLLFNFLCLAALNLIKKQMSRACESAAAWNAWKWGTLMSQKGTTGIGKVLDGQKNPFRRSHCTLGHWIFTTSPPFSPSLQLHEIPSIPASQHNVCWR